MSIPVKSDQTNSNNTRQENHHDKFQYLDPTATELKKRAGSDKKKRPEDMVDPLATVASMVWANEPRDIQLSAEYLLALNFEFGPVIQEGQEQDQKTNSPSILFENKFNNQESQLPRNLRTTDSLVLSDKASRENLGQTEAATEIMTAPTTGEVRPTAEPINLNPFNSHRSIAPDVDKNDSSIDAKVLITEGSKSILPQFDSNFSQVESKQSIVDSVEFQDEITSFSELTDMAEASNSNLFKFGHINKDEKEKLEGGEPLPFNPVNAKLNNSYISNSQQEFGSSTNKNLAEKARAEFSAQSSQNQGVNYTFKSWGLGNNSVRITGAAEQGFMAQSSNSEVASVLDKHLPVDGSLSLTIRKDNLQSSKQTQADEQPETQDDHAQE